MTREHVMGTRKKLKEPVSLQVEGNTEDADIPSWTKVFITDDLTKARAKLAYQARVLKRMSINCSSYFVLFVVILCLYFDAPCFHGLLFLQYTWIVKCIENISTLIFFLRQREKFSKTYSNMAKLKTCSYEYGWMSCMFKTCSESFQCCYLCHL